MRLNISMPLSPGSITSRAIRSNCFSSAKASREVRVDGHLVELTKREFDLLAYLMQNKGLVMSRDLLLDRVWGYDFIGETNAIDVYIRYIRAKIEEPFGVKIIQTIRGVGYVIRDEQ